MEKKNVTKVLQKSRNKDIISLEKQLNGNLTEVLGWFVEKKSTGDIKERLKEKFSIETNRMSVWRFSQSRKWKPIIARGRQELAKHIAKIPCANKENRLLTYQKIIDEGLKWSLKTITKDGDEIYELKLGPVNEALKGAREEVEGGKNQGVQIINVNFGYRTNTPASFDRFSAVRNKTGSVIPT